jgi:hypothetical protein
MNNLSSSTVKLCHYCHVGAKRERRYSSYSIYSSSLGGDKGVSSQHHTADTLYYLEGTHSTHWIGGWVDLRAGLDTEVRRKILRL